MGMFDRFKSQARGEAKKQSDSAERRANEKTGGKYEQRIEGAGGTRRQQPPEEQR